MKKPSLMRRAAAMFVAVTVPVGTVLPAIFARPAAAAVAVRCQPTLPISVGGDQTLSVASDGTVWSWGSNWAGQLGNWSNTSSPSPVHVYGLTGVMAVAAGANHSLALKTDGTVWGWGWNSSGQVGDGTTINRNTPSQVYGLTNIVAIAAGNYHSMALAADRTVYTWGYNSYGQLGLGGTDTSNRYVPVQAPGLTGVSAIAAGGTHSMALRGGAVYTWGSNGDGQIGNGSQYGNVTTPTAVTGPGFVQIAAGNNHSLGVSWDGYVYAWGYNADGELGVGDYAARLFPTPASINSVVDVDAGAYFSMARRSDGSVWTWGSNMYGAFGDGSYGGTWPWPLPSYASGAKVIAAGNNTGAVVTNSGGVWTWGYNGNGQVGNGGWTDQAAPVNIGGVTQATPAAPRDLTATAGNGLVYLTWTAPASNLTQYVVTPYINGVAQPEVAADPGATSYTVSGLTAGTTYSFTVKGQNCLGAGTDTAQSTRVIPTGVQLNEAGFKIEGMEITDRLDLHVNTFNGNLAVHENDVRIRGTGLNLAVDRAYNNLANATSIFGNNWTTTVGNDVKLVALGYGSQMFNGPGGYQLGFAQNADGTFASPPGIDADLVRNGDGAFTLSYHATGETWRFSSAGLVTSTADKNGNSLTYAYGGPGGLISSVTDTQGRVASFAYNASNLVSTITDSTGRTWRYGYDGSRNLTSYTDPASGVTAFAYDASRNLTQITTPAGRVVRLGYDASKRVTSLSWPRQAGAPTTSFTYNTGDTVVTDANGRPTTYAFDPVGRTTKVTDANGAVTTASYTSASNVQRYQPGSSATTFSYSSVNNLTSVSGSTGQQSTMAYGDAAHPYYPTGITDPQGNTLTMAYDAAGNLRTQTDQLPSQNQVSIAYGTRGNPSSSVNPNGATTSYAYDAAGNLTGITPPSGSSPAPPPPPPSSAVAFRSETSGRWASPYTSATVREPAGAAAGDILVCYIVNNTGTMGTVTPPAGWRALGAAGASLGTGSGLVMQSFWIERGAAAPGLTFTARLALGWHVQAYSGASGGSLVAGSGTMTAASRTVNLSSLTTTVNGSLYVAAMAFPSNTVTAAPSGTTLRTKQALAPDSQTADATIATAGTVPARTATLSAATNNLGFPFAVSPPASSPSLPPPPPPASLSTPLGASSLAYDSLSRVTRTTDGKGQTTTFAFDALDRLSTTTYADGASVARTYDGDGNMSRVVDPAGTTTMAYDAMGRMTSRTTPDGNTAAYAYDRVGNLLSVTDRSGTTTFTYNAVNLPITVSDGVSGTITMSYDANYNRTSVRYPNGVTVTSTYDSSNRLTRVSNIAGSTTLSSFTYGYWRGRDTALRQTMTDLAGAVTTYTYDALNRLSQARTLTAGRSLVSDYVYSYDGAGNRLSQSVYDRTTGTYAATTYTYNAADQLTSVNGAPLAYDANGNLIQDHIGRLFTYNAANQTTEIRSADAAHASFAYLGGGQSERLSGGAAPGAGVTNYTTTSLGVSGETTASTATSYLHDRRGGLLAERTPMGTYWVLPDGEGSIMALADSAGRVVTGYSYDPFGQVTATSGTPTLNSWRFANGYLDGSGLYKMGERYYDPTLGRWTQQDPITSLTDPKLWNRYVYVGNDPVNFVDPSGLEACASTGNTFLSVVFTIITVTSFILSFFAFFGLASVVTTFFKVSASTGLAIQVSAGFAAGALAAADTENRLCSGQSPSTSY